MVPPNSGCGWHKTQISTGARSSGSSTSVSSFPAGPSSRCDSIRRGNLVGPEIDKLHIDAEIAAAQQLNHLLQGVPVAAANAHQIRLNGSLYLQLAVFDLLDDLPRLLDGDALLQADFLVDGGSGRRNQRPVLQALEWNFADRKSTRLNY